MFALKVEDYLILTSCWKRVFSNRLNVLAYIDEHLTDNVVQAVADFDGERHADYYDENGYCDLVRGLWEKAGGEDTGSSSGAHGNYKFVSDYVISKMAREIGLAKRLKLEKIERLRKEIEQLENKIKD